MAGPSENVVRGIAFMLISVACMSTMDVLGKWVVATVAVPQMIALRSVIVLALAAPLVVRAGGLSTLATRRPRGHALRVALSVGAMLTFFEGLRQLPLATAISIGFSAPLFMTALSAPFLGEKVGPHRQAAAASSSPAGTTSSGAKRIQFREAAAAREGSTMTDGAIAKKALDLRAEGLVTKSIGMVIVGALPFKLRLALALDIRSGKTIHSFA